MSHQLKISDYLRAMEEIRAKRLQSVLPFEDVSPEACRLRRERAAKDPGWFLRTYLPHWFETELSEFHRALIGVSLLRDKPSATVGPRGFGKSTVTSFGMPIWKMLCAGYRFGFVQSITEDLASNFVTAVRDEFEANERLLCDYGPQWTEGAWTQTDFTIRSGARLMALGLSQPIRGLVTRGQRPDFGVFDDLEDEELARNPDRVNALLTDMMAKVIPALSPKGWTLTWVGTLVSKTAALSRLVKGDSEFSHAWECRIWRSRDERGESIAPLIKSTAFLDAELARLGSRLYAQEYDGEPNEDGMMFRPSWETSYPDALIGRWDGFRLAAHSDPAAGQGRSNDFKVIVVDALKDGRHHIAEVRIRKDSPEEYVRAHYDIYERFGRKIGVWRFESNGFASLYKEPFRYEAQRRGYSLPFTMWTAREAKETRIGRAAPVMERGELLTNRNVGDTRILLDQLFAYPRTSVKDDGPDAMAGAMDGHRTAAGRIKAFARRR
ncbi:MAG: hypothetical protein KIT79_12660 [Deltaproteobacteria bacterium]|nr:hypothetical protein [Deltaproteobacteria bacterium]